MSALEMDNGGDWDGNTPEAVHGATRFDTCSKEVVRCRHFPR